jgi:hypothetical protein
MAPEHASHFPVSQQPASDHPPADPLALMLILPMALAALAAMGWLCLRLAGA